MKQLMVMIAIGVWSASPLLAQSQATRDASSLAFEAASVKRNESADANRVARFQPGGRFSARNITLGQLIAIAYGDPRPLSSFGMSGGPAWIDEEGFDLDARAADGFPDLSAGSGFPASGRSMLQALLAERFQLAVHREQREQVVFTLVMARRDGRTGPRFRAASGADCFDAADDSSPMPRCGVRRVRGRENGARIIATGATMDEVARNLELAPLSRMVLNRTGLGGRYSFDIEFDDVWRPRDIWAGNRSSIFTVLGELGLKLQAERLSVDVLVVDRAARPSKS